MLIQNPRKRGENKVDTGPRKRTQSRKRVTVRLYWSPEEDVKSAKRMHRLPEEG